MRETEKSPCFLLPIIAFSRTLLDFWVSKSTGCDFLHFWKWRNKRTFNFHNLSVVHSAVWLWLLASHITHLKGNRGELRKQATEGIWEHCWLMHCHHLVQGRCCSIKLSDTPKRKCFFNSWNPKIQTSRIPFSQSWYHHILSHELQPGNLAFFHWLSCFYWL